MSPKIDVVALGELLIDFTSYGLSSQGNPLYEANPGGAPCNVLAILKRLSKSASFIGKVGDDVYGHQLHDAIVNAGIGDEGLIYDKEVHTTLAIVSKKPNGDRDFAFYRNPGADMMLSDAELPLPLIERARIFHFGTLSMTHEGVRKATEKAIEAAKASGALISFDPNMRPPLWDSQEAMVEAAEWGIAHCDILKISDNEIDLVTGEKDPYKALAKLREHYPNVRFISLTFGADGSYASFLDKVIYVPAFRVDAIETTGAGDAYGGAMLSGLLEHELASLDEETVLKMMRLASAAAALVTLRKGALAVMPSREEIETFLADRP